MIIRRSIHENPRIWQRSIFQNIQKQTSDTVAMEAGTMSVSSTTMTVTMGDDSENPVTLTECSIIPPSDSTSDGLRGASRATIISSVLQHHHGRSKCLPNQGSMSKKVESSWSLFPPGSRKIGPNCLPRKRALYCTSSFTRVCPLSQPFSTRNGKKEKNTLNSFSRNLLTGLTWTTENLVKVISKHLKNFHSIHVWPVSSGRKNLVSLFPEFSNESQWAEWESEDV